MAANIRLYGLVLMILVLARLSPAQCSFTISNQNPCGGIPVDLSVINPTANYSWDLNDDGVIDTSGSTLSYAFPGGSAISPVPIALYADNVLCHRDTIFVRPTPDPSIGVVPGSGIIDGSMIRICSGSPDVDLSIYNASTTLLQNLNYEINWGDGTIENFTNLNFNAASFITHTYNGFGYYTIRVTIEGAGGCNFSNTYTFYNGGNPSVGLANPGNTTGICIPVSITFPITNTVNNPEGTLYYFYVADSLVATFNQSTIPASYTYLFTETSCGHNTANYENAFDVYIEAVNPCGSSQATIEPIEISTPPVAQFNVQAPAGNCLTEVYTFTNNSTGINEVVSGNPSTCETSLVPAWVISPGVAGQDWNIVSGNLFASDELQIQFLRPGDYTIRMTIISDACGPASTEQVIRIVEPPSAGAEITLTSPGNNGTECTPVIALLTNLSSGESISTTWSVSPSTGWTFLDSNNFDSTDLRLQFNEAGSYTISLHAANICGIDTWDTTLVLANKPVIELDPILGFCQSAILHFDTANVRFNANHGQFLSFNWSFPGGSPSGSTEQYPTDIHYDSPGHYTISVTATNQCGHTSVSQSFFIQTPGVLTLSQDTTLCASDGYLDLSASPAGGSWSGSGITPSGTFDPVTANIGLNTLYYTYQDNLCTLTDSTTIDLLALPAVTAGPDETVCIDRSPFALTGESPPGGLWRVDNGGVIKPGNIFDPGASGSGVYTLQYSYTDRNGCTNSAYKTIEVNELPLVDAGPDQVICDNPNDIPLTGFAPAGGNWTGTGITPEGVFNAGNTPGVGSYTLYYTFTDPEVGCTSSDSMLINIVANPQADAGKNDTVCVDGTAFSILTGSPAGGSWSGPGITGIDRFDPALAGTGLHTLTYSFGTGACETTDEKTILVQDLPRLSLIEDLHLCIDDMPIDLGAASPPGGEWSGSGIDEQTFDPAAAGTGTHILTYRYSDPVTGCSNADSVRVSVQPLPVLSARDTSYCHAPGFVDLPVVQPGGGIWSGPGVFGSSFDPALAGGPGSYQLVYAYTDTFSCSASIVVNVTVVNPSLVDAGPDLEYCLDESVIDLQAVATPPGGNWYGNGSNGLIDGLFDPATAGVGSHVLTYSIGEGNCRVSDNLFIEVHPLPEVDAGADSEICVSETILVLNGTPAGGSWTVNNSGVLVDSTFNPNASGPGVYTFNYTYYGNLGCAQIDELTVLVHGLPVININDTTYCNTPGLVPLPFARPAGGTWNGPGVIGSAFDPLLAGGIGNYALNYTYTDHDGCQNQRTVGVEVIPSRVVSAGKDTSVCVDGPAFDLSDLASPPGGNWSSDGSEGLSGSWFDPAAAGPGVHELTYSIDEGNCEVSDDIAIIINPLPVVYAGADTEVCISETELELIGTPAGGTWSVDNQGVLNGNAFNPNASGTGVYTVTYTYTDGTNCTRSDERLITVNDLPLIESNDTLYCNTSGLVNLPQASPTGGIWSGIGVFGNQFEPQLAGGAGNYVLRYSYADADGCENSHNITVSVIEPESVFAGPDTVLCIYDPLLNLQLLASPPGGVWTSNGSPGLSGNNFDPVQAGTGIHTLTYTIGSDNCQVSDHINVEVAALPAVEAGKDLSICYGEGAITLSGYGPVGGQWSGPGIVDALTGRFDPGIAGAGEHTIRYSYRNELSGCQATDTRRITVFAMEPPVFDSPQITCVNDSVIFLNHSPILYTAHWDFGDGNSASTFNGRHAYAEPNTYSVLLTVKNEFGCTDSIRHNIFVTEAPTANFLPDTTEACRGIDMGLTNLSYGYDISYLWDFGNDSISTVPEPDLIFYSQGTYDTTYVLTLTASNGCGSDVHQDTLLVHPLPEMRFGVLPDSDCSPVLYNFANVSTGSPQTYEWDLGNGVTTFDSLPAPQEYTAGDDISYYTITLIGTNVCGADTTSTQIAVNPPDVNAFFNLSTPGGCAPLEVEFYSYATAESLIDWDFGDGNKASISNPTHTFTEPGEYRITQYATSQCGRDSTSLTVTVTAPPEVGFEHSPYVCEGQAIEFTNLSANISGALWSFGDGDSSTLSSPTHVYNTPGTYRVNLTGYSNSNHCPATFTGEVIVRGRPTPAFTPSAYNGCAPLSIDFGNESTDGAVFYQWDFGDGNTSVETNPSHTFEEASTYTVRLVVTDNFGCFNDSTIYNIIAHPRPVAAFTFDQEQLCGVPANIHLENLSEGATGYVWDFGDGTGSTLNHPFHSFQADHSFEISLIATNQFACSDTTMETIRTYQQPVANFDIEDFEGCSPVQVQFINRSDQSNRYYWDFGDGLEASEAHSPSHTFTTSGSYSIQLIASRDDICFDTLIRSGLVTVFPRPVAAFNPIELQIDGKPSGTFEMLNTSENANRFFWDFGDGTSSTEEHPRHRYPSNGSRQVYLEAVNAYGCVDDTLITLDPECFTGLFIPNAFSPEQGIGDVRLFKPAGVGLEEYHIQIYSPYGQLLWESTALENSQPAEAWDGTHNGKLQPQDVYVWKVFAIFKDGTVWAGQKNSYGQFQTVGSVVLLR